MRRTLVVLLSLLPPAGVAAQANPRPAPPPAADSAAVRAAVLDYVEAIYRADTSRILRSVRPELAKRGYFIPRGQSGYTNEPMTFAELLTTARTWNASGRVDADKAIKEVKILDLLDQTASAKLVAVWGVDYLHLARYDGRWMIVNILWQTPPR
ncbi:MAG TPA: nuclear transport factor 2 family protein [Gemmatimonadales bacterium]